MDEVLIPKNFKVVFDVQLRHFDRYLKALKLLGRYGTNEIWLDCACGSGYGTNLLSNFATKTVGYDINKEILNYAETIYGTDNCEFIDKLGYDIKYDVIFCIETIEHVSSTEARSFLSKFRQILNQGSKLIISTPIVEESNNNPTNPYHKYEYDLNEFLKLLLEFKFKVIDYTVDKAIMTDGEYKNQGFFKCIKLK